MAGIDDSAPSPEVLCNSRLTAEPLCLHCGYSLQGLRTGHKCPECGRLPDKQAERQAVLDVINQPMLKLGWRMLQFWNPLPAGWWWVLDDPRHRREARRRTWKWILGSGLLMLVLMCSIVMVNRTITIIKYEHPPGEPDKKQVRARGFSSGVMSSVSVTVTPSRPGWVVLTERTEEVVLDFQFNRMLRMAFFVVGIVLLTWLMMRWVWLPICLATGPRKKSAPELKAIKTIALYQYAPMLTLLLVEMFLSWINWALYTLGWIDESRLIVVVAAPLLHAGLIGTTWAAAITSDRTGQIFRHKLLPILGIILAAGPGGMLAMYLIGGLMTLLFP